MCAVIFLHILLPVHPFSSRELKESPLIQTGPQKLVCQIPWRWWSLIWWVWGAMKQFPFLSQSFVMGSQRSPSDTFFCCQALDDVGCLPGITFQHCQGDCPLCLSPWWQRLLNWWCFSGTAREVHLSALSLMMEVTYLVMLLNPTKHTQPSWITPSWWGLLPGYSYGHHQVPSRYSFLSQSLMIGIT